MRRPTKWGSMEAASAPGSAFYPCRRGGETPEGSWIWEKDKKSWRCHTVSSRTQKLFPLPPPFHLLRSRSRNSPSSSLTDALCSEGGGETRNSPFSANPILLSPLKPSSSEEEVEEDVAAAAAAKVSSPQLTERRGINGIAEIPTLCEVCPLRKKALFSSICLAVQIPPAFI